MNDAQKLQMIQLKVEELQGDASSVSDLDAPVLNTPVQAMPGSSMDADPQLVSMGDTGGVSPAVMQVSLAPLVGALSLVSSGLSAYHGYRRNQSIPWAIGWAIMGGAFPVVTPAIAFAQGFGEPIRKTNPGDSPPNCISCGAALDEDCDRNDENDEWEMECRRCRLGDDSEDD